MQSEQVVSGSRKSLTIMSNSAVAKSAKKRRRPVSYNLSLFNLPLPGLVSIFHRISGAMLFLLLFWLLYLLDLSLASAESFARFKSIVSHPLSKLILLGLLWAYLHHFFAGLRYLAMEMHWGLDLASARATSTAVFVLSLSLTLILGIVILW